MEGRRTRGISFVYGFSLDSAFCRDSTERAQRKEGVLRDELQNNRRKGEEIF